MDVASIVAILSQLVPVANQLTSLLESIKTNNPDVWAQVEANYKKSEADFNAS